MATKLDKTIKREIELDGQAYMVAISPEGVKMTQKGFRKGREISWRELWNSGSEEGRGGTSSSSGNAGGSRSGAAQNTGGVTPPSDPGRNPPASG
jgi:hypothetical protein